MPPVSQVWFAFNPVWKDKLGKIMNVLAKNKVNKRKEK
jgi:hypothetical protein